MDQIKILYLAAFLSIAVNVIFTIEFYMLDSKFKSILSNIDSVRDKVKKLESTLQWKK